MAKADVLTGDDAQKQEATDKLDFEKLARTKSMEMVINSLSKEDRKRLRQVFDRIDRDRSGHIDKYELGAFLAFQWKHIMPQETLEHLLELVDVNKDGKIQFEEFIRLQIRYMPLCRGYCRDCKQILFGTEGYSCPKCQPKRSSVGCEGTHMRGSFTLCPSCYQKTEGRMQHIHSFDCFEKLKLTKVATARQMAHQMVCEECLDPGMVWYKRWLVQPLLEERYRKGD